MFFFFCYYFYSHHGTKNHCSTAFVGLCVYCLFATSKDISIGPTGKHFFFNTMHKQTDHLFFLLFFNLAVMSLLVGQTVTRIVSSDPTITGPEIAVALSLFTGIIAMFIGLVRLGILVDFIPGIYRFLFYA